jgi:D-serine deaminase-like pyridoxal phosphate-dependent protein
MAAWYEISNAHTLDTPCLVVYPDRIQENIQLMIRQVKGDVSRLQPHVKTYKMREVVEMQMAAGIRKFKFATIAEGEMLGQLGVDRALLAYQPVGPKIDRLLKLVQTYPETSYGALVDDKKASEAISAVFAAAGKPLPVYLDLDVGMHRTGIAPDQGAEELFNYCASLPGVNPIGLHVYDGQFRQEFEERKKASDAAFRAVEVLREQLEAHSGKQLDVIAGGSPTFPVHALREHVNCSPGTSLLWDWGYSRKLAEQPFLFAALVLSRVISHPGKGRICVDLGHKSVAAENPFPRVHFFNLPEARQVGQSEEHLVLEVEQPELYPVGTLLYGLPLHICPTVALYESARVVRDGEATGSWRVIARDRKISV